MALGRIYRRERVRLAYQEEGPGMRRAAMVAGLALALAVGGCGGGGGGGQKKPAQGAQSGGSHTPATITFWNGFSSRELGVIKKAVAEFHRTHPWITVK